MDRHLLRDTAYDKLCEAIVDGTLSPGEALHDGALCRWLGLSRTPVREALIRLRDERLIEMEPQRFTRVAPVTAGDVQELLPLLAAIHGLATELAVPRLDATRIAALRAHNDDFVRGLRAGDPTATYDADDRFHAVFVGAPGTPSSHACSAGSSRACAGSSASAGKGCRGAARSPSTRSSSCAPSSATRRARRSRCARTG